MLPSERICIEFSTSMTEGWHPTVGSLPGDLAALSSANTHTGDQTYALHGIKNEKNFSNILNSYSLRNVPGFFNSLNGKLCFCFIEDMEVGGC